MRFSDIIGLNESKESLIKSIKGDKIAHAQMFFGLPGAAALPMALAYATYLNCENPGQTDSCGKCAACSKMDKLSHPDLRIIFPTAGGQKVSSSDFMNEFRENFLNNSYLNPSQWLAIIDKKSGNIPVSESRKLIQDLSLKAYEANYKISIFWQAEKLNIAAANALLKIIEEPPENTIFIFVSYSADSLLSTIISRTQPIRIPSYQVNEIMKFLVDNKGISELEAEQIAFQSEGDLAEAIELSESVSHDIFDWFSNWMRYSFKFNFLQLLPFGDEFDTLSKDHQLTNLGFSLKFFRQIALYNNGAHKLLKINEMQLDFIKNFSKAIIPEKISTVSQLISEAMFQLERNAKAKIVFLDLSIKIAQNLRL